ncbi:helix-turn-helix domain-containing protein [uncultured Psychromonas sp.]|uniref:MerR family transcriptional regulator n=1 Tax=uncultured Psychromonas sp. TaxID=173974 RepID=UPI002604207F|nr:helix-turn-helix domain-containing protein [uncultured Psychromonas sp.]
MIYTIGQLSKKTQCKIPTIRYYEEIGLLDKAMRSAGNQRQYTSSQCQRLHFIRHSRALGFSLDEIKQLIHLQDCKRHDPHQAHQVAQHHLTDVRRRIEQLKALEVELLTMIDNCEGEDTEDCLVLKSLNDVPEKN